MSLLLCAMLAACAARPPDAAEMSRRLQALLPAEVLLIGEQHDAPAHQQLQRTVVQALAANGTLAALALEMAERGASTTNLPPQATEAQVQAALRWHEAGWPWAAYGPVVMAAVQAGVPVLGANLPMGDMRSAMSNRSLDDHLTPDLWQKQQGIMVEGHCGLLPQTQIVPMTRVQTARDAAMAQTAVAARQPGKTVLLIAGNGHVDRELGVPTHLGPEVTHKSVVLNPARDGDDKVGMPPADAVWSTPAPPPKDYCADLRRQMAPAR